MRTKTSLPQVKDGMQTQAPPWLAHHSPPCKLLARRLCCAGRRVRPPAPPPVPAPAFTHCCAAADLQALGRNSDALTLLSGYINPPRRINRQWQRPYQDVMCLLIDLCVVMREGADNMKVLKDSLHQYRQLTQQVCVRACPAARALR